jgi:hypothetical protein
MPAVVTDLAPVLVAGGVSPQEVKDGVLSPPAKSAAQAPPIQAKRFREAMRLLVAQPELTDREVAKKVTSIPADVVATLRKEVAAIKANPDVQVAAAVAEPEPDPKPIGEGPPGSGEEPIGP